MSAWPAASSPRASRRNVWSPEAPPWPGLTGLAAAAGLLAMLAALASTPSIAQTRAVQPAASDTTVRPGQALSFTVYMPFIAAPDAFVQDEPVWTSTATSNPSEVSFFRHRFTLDAPAENAAVVLFADTRYEIWLDGDWLGRGPAPFTTSWREYDVYRLGTLSTGPHLLAVLVQWAPNYRRSESTRPFLQGHVQGTVLGSLATLARTGGQWRALPSAAWRQDAALVHSWGLIGPTELLDLRRLQADWMSPAYNDSAWPSALAVDPGLPSMIQASQSLWSLAPDPGPAPPARLSVTAANPAAQAAYQPRSIPFLAQAPFTPTVVDVGVLSPGRLVGEAPISVTGTVALPFRIFASGVFTVEALPSASAGPTAALTLDGASLTWIAAGAARPDVLVATTTVTTGDHLLALKQIPADGLTFAISTRGVASATVPFGQGVHAGRRLLLAEPVSRPNAVTVSSSGGLTLELTSLPAYVVLDLGRTVHGRLQAQVSGQTGTIVDVGWDERLLPGTLRPLPYPGSLHQQWNQVDSWILDGTPRGLSTIDSRAGRYLLIAAWGNAPVVLRDVRVLEEHYPAEQRGSFASSDPLLDRIWQVGVETLRANMTDAYADPWRERGQWWGDAYVDDHVNQVALGDAAVLGRGLLLMADAFADSAAPGMAPNNAGLHMLDYSMLWAQSLDDYLRRTGDTAVPRAVYSILRAFMAHLASYENQTTGLMDVPEAHWSVTDYIDPRGYSSRYGQSAALNAMYYGTLLRAAEVAAALDDPAAASLWTEKAAVVRESVNQSLYRPTDARYLTGLLGGAPVTPTIHAQAWPLAYGVVPTQEMTAVADSLLELLSPNPAAPNVETYGMYWVLEGLARAGRIAEAISVTKTYYGYMLDHGATTWWEGFNSYLSYSGSLSHGWSGAPTWFLTTHVLGASLTGPATWSVQPAFSGVVSATGVLPLPGGDLAVAWQRASCQDLTLVVGAPAATSGQAVLPLLGSSTTITLNDTAVWRDGHPLAAGVTAGADGIHLSLAAGDHRVLVRGDCLR
jgi:alpha-L-rhamnosidase